MFKRFFLTIFLLLSFVQCNAATLKRIYLDHSQNIHVVNYEGKDLQLTKDGKAMEPALSSDGATAAWLLKESDQDDGSSKLAVYQYDQTRFIECEPFIRRFWFALKGKGIAIDCGGSHFAGHEILYDIPTLKVISSFDQAEVPLDKRPSWSN